MYNIEAGRKRRFGNTPCVKIPYGGILFAAASCMFSAARSVRIAEDRDERKQLDSESVHEPEDPQEG